MSAKFPVYKLSNVSHAQWLSFTGGGKERSPRSGEMNILRIKACLAAFSVR